MARRPWRASGRRQRPSRGSRRNAGDAAGRARTRPSKSPPADVRRTAQRTSCERVNRCLKDQFGGNNLRVRGPTKAMCHLMFGILALTIDQLTRLVA
jgi:hypothetical protein